MQGIDIILIIVGACFVVVSFFLIDRKEISKNARSEQEEQAVTEQTKNMLMDQFKMQSETIASDCIMDTEDKLSKLVTEKMVAINEFSEQLMEKLEGNHQEVVFLYDMMMSKEEEIKSNLNRMEVLRRENQAFIEKIAEFRDAKLKALGRSESESIKKENKEASKGIAYGTGKKIQDISSVSNKSVSQEEPVQKEEEMSESTKQQILELYSMKLSVTEISKRLSLGQGEVKLIIDLYK